MNHIFPVVAVMVAVAVPSAWAGHGGGAGLTAPSSLSANAMSTSQINLAWKNNSSASGNRIQRGPTSGGPWTLIATVGSTTTSYSDINLAASTTYYYRVYAYTSKSSAYSGVAGAATFAAAPVCNYSLTASSASFGSAGGSSSFGVNATAGCTWSASTAASWIHPTGSGTGNGSVSYTVDSNSSSSSRSDSITVAGQTFTVSQSGASCAYSLSPAGTSVAAGGGSGSFSVTATAGCAWSASTSASWIHPTGSGTGNGSVSFTVDSNSSSASRSDVITVAGQTYSVTQSGTACTFSLSPGSGSFGAAGGSSSFSVTATTGCGWSASTTASWVHTSSAGNGNGTASYTVDLNGGAGARSATLTVAGQSFTVNQSGHTAPVANAGGPKTAGVSVAIPFNGSTSYANDGASITSYSWAFGDLTSISGAGLNSVSHAYTGAGTYTVTLTVSDSFGATGSATTTATVTNAVTPPPPGTWSTSFGAVADTDYGLATVVDSSGNVLITGVFQGLANMGGGTLTGLGTGYNIFLAKYSPSGTPLWSKSFGTTLSSEVPKCMALDSAGNIFIGGTLAGGSLMKLDSTGNLLWVKGPVAAAGQSVSFSSVATDSQGNVIVTGSFVAPYNNQLDFGDTHPLYSAYGSTDCFLAKYSPTGTCLWVIDFANGGDTEYGTGVAVDKSDNILLGGYAFSDINLGGGDLVNGNQGAFGFLGKFTSAGSLIWSRMAGSKASTDPSYAFCRLKSLAVDGNGDVVIAGEWDYVVNFGGGSRTASAPNSELFLAKYGGTDGHYVWDTEITGTASAYADSVVTDGQNNILFSGEFSKTYTFGTQTLTADNNNGYVNHGYVAKYTGNGAEVWASNLASSSTASGNSVAVDSGGYSYVTGGFQGTGLIGSQTLTSIGSLDIFLARLDP